MIGVYSRVMGGGLLTAAGKHAAVVCTMCRDFKAGGHSGWGGSKGAQGAPRISQQAAAGGSKLGCQFREGPEGK